MASGRALRAGRAVIELALSSKGIDAQLAKLENKMQNIGGAFKSAGKRMVTGAAAIGAAFVIPIQAASRLEETMNKFNVVFGDNAKAVKVWGDNFASEVGRSQEQIASFMAGTQDLFVPLGFEPGAATELSKQITGLALDLASFNNMQDADTLRDLHAALTGSGEVMKKYGVIVSEAAVKQQLLNQGIDPKLATEQQKVQARLNIIMAGTTAAQGDAIRSAGAYANQMKALQGAMDDAAAKLGQAVLPLVTEFVTRAAAVAKAVGDWLTNNRELAVLLLKFGGYLGVAGAAVYGIGTAFTTASSAVAAFRVAMAFAMANPVILAITAVTAAIAGMYYMLNKSASAAGDLGDALNRVQQDNAANESQAAAALARLRTLSQAAELTKAERKEVQELAHQLRILYGITDSAKGGIGITGGKAGVGGGRVTGLDMAEAQIEAARAASSKSLDLLQHELVQLKGAAQMAEGDELRRITEQIDDRTKAIEKVKTAIANARVIAPAGPAAPESITPATPAPVETPAAIERRGEQLGEAMANILTDKLPAAIGERLAEAGRKIFQAQEAIRAEVEERIAVARETMQSAGITGGQATGGVFDTRLAGQMFGGDRSEDWLKKIYNNTKRKPGDDPGLNAV